MAGRHYVLTTTGRDVVPIEVRILLGTVVRLPLQSNCCVGFSGVYAVLVFWLLTSVLGWLVSHIIRL